MENPKTEPLRCIYGPNATRGGVLLVLHAQVQTGVSRDNTTTDNDLYPHCSGKLSRVISEKWTSSGMDAFSSDTHLVITAQLHKVKCTMILGPL